MNDEMAEGNRNTKDLAAELFDVHDSAVVITGAASGLGFAMAEVMAVNGARVMMSDIDLAGLEIARDKLADRGVEVFITAADVSDELQLDSLMAKANSEFGRIDTVFANAGINAGKNMSQPEGAIEEFSLKDWDRVMSINLFGVFATIRASARVMKQQRSGTIIVTASTAGLRPEPLVGYAYVSAKAAVANLIRQASLELVSYGIRVNGIAPGPFATNIGAGRAPSQAYDNAWLRSIPMGRKGLPEEIKGIVLLLASQASSFVTGSIWTIDGGATALSQLSLDDLESSR